MLHYCSIAELQYDSMTVLPYCRKTNSFTALQSYSSITVLQITVLQNYIIAASIAVLMSDLRYKCSTAYYICIFQQGYPAPASMGPLVIVCPQIHQIVATLNKAAQCSTIGYSTTRQALPLPSQLIRGCLRRGSASR